MKTARDWVFEYTNGEEHERRRQALLWAMEYEKTGKTIEPDKQSATEIQRYAWRLLTRGEPKPVTLATVMWAVFLGNLLLSLLAAIIWFLAHS